MKTLSKPVKPMRGAKLAGCEVLEQMPGVSRQSRWRVRADACGHVFPKEQGDLVRRERKGKVVFCPICNPRKESL